MFQHRHFDHEDVHFFNDKETGLQCIIAVHRVISGTTGGGCRFFPYNSTQDAVNDVLLLSRAMTYKNIMAGLPMGGGKAVIIGNPDTDKTPEILTAFAKCVDSLGGRYVTACDVGTNEDDMFRVREVTSYTMGARGQGGSTSPLTGYGVYQSMLAAWQFHTNQNTLEGVKVAVQGFGGVGTYLINYLQEAGAEVVVADPHPEAVQRARDAGIPVVPVGEILFQDVDILSPCAMGAVLNDETIGRIQAKVICGGANNQLADLGCADQLMGKGITFVPDFVASAGGIIHGEGHYNGRSERDILTTVENIYNTTAQVLGHAREFAQTPLTSAYSLAEEKIGCVNSVEI